MHLSIFPPREGEGGINPRELDYLINSIPMSHKRVSKIAWTFLKIYTYFLLEFQSKVSKAPVKVFCQNPGESDFLVV